ncbi:hypothetical protein UCRNP2_27 [Neofusicoccum parvum UCRNP2]|uniref:Uncharacterized protein n=1 Tax=Botryosphaeria parva (strain UCR-NP2) TaxID=1287680 RepID=R1EZG0_BOTPV|nr:hypothetical protein UCRNP2_27 [Neofusicoccum parvum UCRNP2]
MSNTDGGGEVDQQTESGTELDSTEVIETLCYKHVALILIPKRDDVRDMLAMEIDLRFVKGHKRNFKRKMYCLYEVDDLIFDPVLWFGLTNIVIAPV